VRPKCNLARSRRTAWNGRQPLLRPCPDPDCALHLSPARSRFDRGLRRRLRSQPRERPPPACPSRWRSHPPAAMCTRAPRSAY